MPRSPAETAYKAGAELRVEAPCAGVLHADQSAGCRVKRQTLEIAASALKRDTDVENEAVEIDKL